MEILDLVGVAGFIAYISAYALLQGGVLEGRSLNYTLLNLTGATLVLVSLMDKFNLGSALIQISWIAVSLWGLGRLFFAGSTDLQKDENDSIIGSIHSRGWSFHWKVAAIAYFHSQRRRVKLCLQIRKERKTLRDLGQDQLDDIGIQKVDVVREASKPWTDIPAARLRDEELTELRRDVSSKIYTRGYSLDHTLCF